MEQNQEPQSSRPMTFGEKLVGLNFNPSGDPKVHKAKQLFAELADLIMESPENSEPPNSMKKVLINHTINEILGAQMYVVKVLTFKD